MMKILKKFFSFIFDIIETIVLALAIFVVIYLFLFQPHQVKGASMEANFYDSEYILTDKVTYRLRPPQRGEVIIFKAPKNPDLDYIKRIIGLPGEKIKIDNGKVIINDQQLVESYLLKGAVVSGGFYLPEGREVTIPEDSYFVLGDNRSHSSDSREWGLVHKNNIIGRAFLRYWPPQRIGILAQVKY